MMILIAVLGLAVIFGTILWHQRGKQKLAARWPATRGRILSAQVHRPSGAEDISENEPIISYEYAVNGTTYRCRRVKYGFTPKVAPTLRKYPVGVEVDVFYDPANPSNAVLER